ncbi:Na+/H+ antiporter NhaD/arsenite permease-like protein [Thermosipho japonicus]|uniref:Na+/H+ antiporter NhaD/arsenite permease-like protein n=1 Tax=Thermosipho japonicus TaxID=90323 RepID=A0A841GHZ9_9BACT|nr:SLC13 family permease [Thermosipho japonicus]MBB6063346.1 Na+/H+ antiporter NhaD/arsenite permease-like protein [Thermosipho japonicus]
MSLKAILVLILVSIAYLYIIFGKKNKSVVVFSIALLISAFRLVDGMVTENFSHIVDLDTLGLLTGMMIIVAFLNKSGFFEFFSIKIIKIGGKKFYLTVTLLMIIVALTSAFLDNVVTILVMAPMIFLISDMLEMDPIPLIMLTILMDNIGGSATLIGSPLNLVIGSISGLSFNDFLIKMGPVAILAFIGVLFYFKRHVKVNEKMLKNIEKLFELDENKSITDKKMMVFSLIDFVIVIVLFILHSLLNVELAVIALLGGSFLIFKFANGYEDVGKEIDWDMLFFFAGLYMTSYALEEIGFTEKIASMFNPIINHHILVLFVFYIISILTVPILNNVPTALILAPVIRILVSRGVSPVLWWTFAVGANFATSLTPLGAVQNIVAVNFLEKNLGRKFGFFEYFRWKIVPVLITLFIGALYIMYLLLF